MVLLSTCSPSVAHEESVEFTSGNNTLGGVITYPAGRGPVPGVVLITGAADSVTRQRAGIQNSFHVSHAEHFAELGLAVLRYDPRGVGVSTGSSGIETMTMRADELRRAQPESFVEIHPDDAAQLGIQSGHRIKITSRRGASIIKARVIDTPRPGMVFVPFHWEDDDSLINRVTIDAYDPGSKQPEFKICAVKLERV